MQSRSLGDRRWPWILVFCATVGVGCGSTSKTSDASNDSNTATSANGGASSTTSGTSNDGSTTVGSTDGGASTSTTVGGATDGNGATSGTPRTTGGGAGQTASGGSDAADSPEEVAAQHCDSFLTRPSVAVDGTLDPNAPVEADGTLYYATLGPVEEPFGYIGWFTLTIQGPGRYLIVVLEDRPAGLQSYASIRELDGGPEPADYQSCSECWTVCDFAVTGGSYHLEPGSYRLLVRSDSMNLVYLLVTPIDAG